VAFEPEPGLVVRYDFLWSDERARGRDQGAKDRPCAIVVATAWRSDGTRDVVLCPITRSPVGPGESGVAVPPAVARHLGLDDAQSWIKTHEVNVLTWEAGRLPFGIVRAREGAWTFGRLPDALGRRVFEEVRGLARAGRLARIHRDED